MLRNYKKIFLDVKSLINNIPLDDIIAITLWKVYDEGNINNNLSCVIIHFYEYSSYEKNTEQITNMADKPTENTVQNFSIYVLLEVKQAISLSFNENILTRFEPTRKRPN